MIGLGDSQDLYRGVVELCTDALMVADVEANILSVSPRTVEMFAPTSSEGSSRASWATSTTRS